MNHQKPKAILVDVIPLEMSKHEALTRLGELENLTNTYGGIVVVKVIQKRGLPDYETYIGKGKVQELKEIGEKENCQLVIVNNILKPKQIFNLNEAFGKAKIKTWDRIDLILKIFDQHAKSTLAKLQIQLASIRHMGPRIFNMGIELMQQTGAVGQKGGAGETNIEIMKRHLKEQEQAIKKKLEHYELIDEGHRRRRRRQNFKTVALVGYTNAGKSSIMKALTGKDVYIADQLFATLDTRVGKIYIPPREENNNGSYHPGKEILLSDTIGFIQDLPPGLIEAFKSTLAETMDADLVLHVIDINDSGMAKKIAVVEDILIQIGLQDKPKIYVFNKIDLIKNHNLPEHLKIDLLAHRIYPGIIKAGAGASHLLGWKHLEELTKDAKKYTFNNPKQLKRRYKEFTPVFVSAISGNGIQDLLEVIEAKSG